MWTPEHLDDLRRKVRVFIQRIEKGMLGPWMMGEMVGYTVALYTSIPSMVGP